MLRFAGMALLLKSTKDEGEGGKSKENESRVLSF